jgi:hypothetical protein
MDKKGKETKLVGTKLNQSIKSSFVPRIKTVTLKAPTSFDQGLLNISPKEVCLTDASEFDCCLMDCSLPRVRGCATTKTMMPHWR